MLDECYRAGSIQNTKQLLNHPISDRAIYRLLAGTRDSYMADNGMLFTVPVHVINPTSHAGYRRPLSPLETL